MDNVALSTFWLYMSWQILALCVFSKNSVDKLSELINYTVKEVSWNSVSFVLENIFLLETLISTSGCGVTVMIKKLSNDSKVLLSFIFKNIISFIAFMP
jgi:hypothetical protein